MKSITPHGITGPETVKAADRNHKRLAVLVLREDLKKPGISQLQEHNPNEWKGTFSNQFVI
jgi:hypothetical protein